MNNALRTHAAAAMLLLPLAAAVMVQPVSAEQAVVAQSGPRYTVAAQPRVQSMALNANAGLAPGSTLRVQVTASPGADTASVRLRGSGVRVALRERAPGEYVGNYTVRRSDRIDASRMMVAQFSWGDRVIAQNFDYPSAFRTLASGAGRDLRDDRAPRISELTPSNGARLGERGRTSIHARFSDDGSGVDPRSVRVRVDGLDVTQEARIQDDGVTYVERLGRGRHSAEIEVRDRAGNAARTSWTFNVV
jgi:hypothetical protein